MRTNIHGYPYKIDDIGYVISDQLEIRMGTCVSDSHYIGPTTSYQFLMKDNKQIETHIHIMNFIH